MGSVKSIVGLDLFTFGDVDGIGKDARLQHPIGVELCDGSLWIADTYNNKIKRLEPVSGDCQSVFGSGASGHEDGAADVASFFEPAGISAFNGRLYIADTNNHAIRVADMGSMQVTTLDVTGL